MKGKGINEQILNRIINAIDLTNCLKNPNFVAPLMKIMTEGVNVWKEQIKNFSVLMSNLMFIYFHYNTSNEYFELLKDAPAL